MKWATIKNTKKGHIPRHTKMRNLQGQLAADIKRAATLAQYLEERHRAPIKTEDHTEEDIEQEIAAERLIYEPVGNNEGFNLEDLTAEEIIWAITKLKLNKSSGPDHTTLEIFKVLNEENWQYLLNIYGQFAY